MRTMNKWMQATVLILGLAIGIGYSEAGSIAIGSVSLSGLAVASIVGLVLNAVLPGRDDSFADTPNDQLSGSLGKY